jgi:hypothetical protein
MLAYKSQTIEWLINNKLDKKVERNDRKIIWCYVTIPEWKECEYVQNYTKTGLWFMCSDTSRETAKKKATIAFFPSCLFVRMEPLGSHWMDFHGIWYVFF